MKIRSDHMNRNRKHNWWKRMARLSFVFAVMMVFTTCIEPWDSGIEEENELISIDGSLILGRDLQTITITRTTSLVDPRFLPLRDCDVVVVDNLGNEYPFEQVTDGVYTRTMGPDELVVNREYMMIVNSPDGARYESEFEKLNRSVPVDTLYFELDNDVDPITGQDLSGLQFYVDVKSSDTLSRFYRWTLDETWEYTMAAPISWVYDFIYGELERIVPDDEFEVYRCWVNMPVDELFLTSTLNLTTNEKKKIPLHYVSTRTDRLRIKYSLFVKQYTLNEKAYNYWDQIRVSLQDSDGLYNSQPGEPITNIVNVNDTTESVLGFFWVSSLTTKRLTFRRPGNLMVPDEFCDLVEFDFVTHIIDGNPPVYIYFDENLGIEFTAPYECFNCTSRGGTTEQPDYWNE